MTISSDEKLQQLCRDYFFCLLRLCPPMATAMGIHDYDEEMPEGTIEEEEEIEKQRKTLLGRLKGIEPDTLSFAGAVDREALINALEIGIFEDEALPLQKSQPQVGMMIGVGLNNLFIKEHAPFEKRIELIAARMEKIPRYLSNARKLLRTPVKLWVETARNEILGLKSLLEIICRAAADEGIRGSLLSRLDSGAAAADRAIEDYCRWLEEDVLPRSGDSFAMGSEAFEKLIALRHLGMNTDQLLIFGENVLAEARENLRRIAGTIAPGKTVDEVREMLKQDHPQTFEDVLKATRRAVAESRDFVKKSGYATLPEKERLDVLETPPFARGMIPFGAYMPPGRFDEDPVGIYWMSRPSDGGGQSLSMHNYGAIINTSVHEGYPGHHLQLSCGNTNPSFARTLIKAMEFVEGWAHYCEEMVARMGYSDSPPVMFERTVDMIWRAIRIIVDVKLSGGLIGFDEAVDVLQRESGFDRTSCITEVRRYTFTPGYQLSYLVGKKMITDLMESIRSRYGDKFDLRLFHDSMLYSGILPMKYMEKVVRKAFEDKFNKAPVLP